MISRTRTAALTSTGSDSTAVLQVFTKGQVHGSHRFTCSDGFYKIPDFCVGFREDGSCFGFKGIFAQSNSFDLSKDEYVLWVPRPTIALVHADDPLVPTTCLKYANMKPIEERPDEIEQLRRRIDELEKKVSSN